MSRIFSRRDTNKAARFIVATACLENRHLDCRLDFRFSPLVAVPEVRGLTLNSQPAMKLHIIYTVGSMLLSRKAYASWREIQAEYPDYKTSLGPWSVEQVVEYLQSDYPELSPPASAQVGQLLSSESVSIELSFKAVK
jgi:hypothetical protein